MQKELLIVSNVMPRPFPAVVMLLTTFIACNSFAGRDAGQMSAQGKANKEAIARRTAASDAGIASNDVLPLDHGRHASTTVGLNQQRILQRAKGASTTGSTAGTSPSIQH